MSDASNEQEKFYEQVREPCCDECGRSLIKGQYCWDATRHSNLSLAERTFQLGYYYSNTSELRKHIIELKTNYNYAVPIGTAMAMAIRYKYGEVLKSNLLVPLPSYNKERNHSYELCEIISKYLRDNLQTSIPVHNAIEKTEDIRLHFLGSQSERSEKAEGMFAARSDIAVKGQDVTLIDDLLTDGSSKNQCLTILKTQGARKIWVFVAAGT